MHVINQDDAMFFVLAISYVSNNRLHETKLVSFDNIYIHVTVSDISIVSGFFQIFKIHLNILTRKFLMITKHMWYLLRVVKWSLIKIIHALKDNYISYGMERYKLLTWCCRIGSMLGEEVISVFSTSCWCWKNLISYLAPEMFHSTLTNHWPLCIWCK